MVTKANASRLLYEQLMPLSDMRWKAGCGDTIEPRLTVHTLQTQSADRGNIEVIVGKGKGITPTREDLEQDNLVVECGPYLLSVACSMARHENPAGRGPS